MVPDMLDVQRRTLMDVKTFNFSTTRYRPIRFKDDKQCDTVRARQDEVHGQLLNKARKIDKIHNAWQRSKGNEGPVTRHFMSFGRCEGLTIGAHGECSADIQNLINLMAQRGAQRRYREMGFKSPIAAKITVLAQVSLAIGIEAIRGVSRVRLANLDTVLAGHASSKAAEYRRANTSKRAAARATRRLHGSKCL